MPSVQTVTDVAFRWILVMAATGGLGCAASEPGGPAEDPPVIDAPAAVPDARAGGPDGAGPVDAGPTADAEVAACGPATWAPGTHQTIMLSHGGVARSYVVHVGDAVRADAPAALIVNFHGLNNSPSIQQGFSRMNDLADSAGFVVVYPQGLGSSFNAGGCCGSSASNDVDDVGFARAIVADVASKVCVDRRRVYATGFSNGGYMSHRLGCEASDLFAAIAPVSGALAVPACTPPRPVPVIAFHGSADTIVAYDDGKAAVERWVTRDGCTGAPVRTMHGSSYCDRWSTCAGGSAVELCTITGWWHLWPSATSAYPATPAIWEFLRQHALPE